MVALAASLSLVANAHLSQQGMCLEGPHKDRAQGWRCKWIGEVIRDLNMKEEPFSQTI